MGISQLSVYQWKKIKIHNVQNQANEKCIYSNDNYAEFFVVRLIKNH